MILELMRSFEENKTKEEQKPLPTTIAPPIPDEDSSHETNTNTVSNDKESTTTNTSNETEAANTWQLASAHLCDKMNTTTLWVDGTVEENARLPEASLKSSNPPTRNRTRQELLQEASSASIESNRFCSLLMFLFFGWRKKPLKELYCPEGTTFVFLFFCFLARQWTSLLNCDCLQPDPVARGGAWIGWKPAAVVLVGALVVTEGRGIGVL